MLLSQLRAYSDAVTAAEHHLLCTPMLHIPGLLVVSPAANSSCARIPRCRRLAYTCLDTHCQQVLRAKHLLTSAPTKTPIAHIPGLLVVSPAANSSCSRIPRCRLVFAEQHRQITLSNLDVDVDMSRSSVVAVVRYRVKVPL